MTKKLSGWTYILLEGYCMFDIYSDKKKVNVYSYPNGFGKEPRQTKIVENQFYLPKSKLKKSDKCHGFPCSDCLAVKCRFFSWCDGNFSDMSYEMIRNYRRRDKRKKKRIGILGMLKGKKIKFKEEDRLNVRY